MLLCRSRFFIRCFVIISTFSILLFSAFNAHAAEKINTLEKAGFFGYEPSGIAIRGTDTVAYFTQGKPVKGTDKFTTEWQGATWKFSSQEHLDLFIATPEKYAPQYGGYCAYGVYKGNLVKIEPENWTIIDEKLYLNFNDGIQGAWEKDIQGFIKAADAKFEVLLTQ
ncbi:MAG: YHS domain-containing protein [Granulosicoccus sp.]|jgi:YHS domain-containing protein